MSKIYIPTLYSILSNNLTHLRLISYNIIMKSYGNKHIDLHTARFKFQLRMKQLIRIRRFRNSATIQSRSFRIAIIHYERNNWIRLISQKTFELFINLILRQTRVKRNLCGMQKNHYIIISGTLLSTIQN